MNIENFKIRKYRKKFNLRQEDLAIKIDVSTQLIRMYENGTRNPSIEKKRLICNLFDITLNELEGLNDKEQLKIELMNLILSLNLNKETFEISKEEALRDIHLLNNDMIEIPYIISNAQLYTGRIIRHILNFILENYICESIFTSTRYNEHLLDSDNSTINKLLVKFVKSNIRFIESSIEEIYYKDDDSRYMIPIVEILSDDWEQMKLNTTEFIEVPQKYRDKKLFGYKITNDEMAMKYEVGNVLIAYWTNSYSNNDDVIISINGQYKIRRIQKNEYGILVQSLNQVYENKFYTIEEMEEKNIKIIGVVIGIQLKI